VEKPGPIASAFADATSGIAGLSRRLVQTLEILALLDNETRMDANVH
jgi:hypothetical protein